MTDNMHTVGGYSFTDEDIMEIAWGWPDGWETVRREEIIDMRRWHHTREMVVTDGKDYFIITYNQGNTESQDEDPYPEIYLAEPYETIVTKYRVIDDDSTT